MSITKRKGSPYWWFSFSINGTRYRGSCFTADKKLASEFETKARTQAYKQNKLGRKQDITLREMLNKYWEEHAQGQDWSPSVAGYIKNFIVAWGASIYLSEINDAKYAELVSFLKKKRVGKKVLKKGEKPKFMSAGTINRHMNAFRKAYNLAKDTWGYDVAKINFALHRLKEPDSRVRYITTEEAKCLISASSEHLRPIIRFALYTGARKSNILNLRWKDVDMVGKRITFKVKSHMPGGKNHVIPMVKDLYDMLKSIPKDSIYVFTYKGKPVAGIKKAFAGACKRAGIIDFRFHDLRHTCASWLVQDGAQLAVVRDILGHTTSKMTEKYAHHEKKQQLSAMEHTFKGRVGI